MRKKILFLLFISCTLFAGAQDVIELEFEKSNAIAWKGNEKEYYSEAWSTEVVTNVSKPSMLVYKPATGSNCGAAVIIAPGGALYAHSINSEGREVAKWLAKNGITAFVLKYRLVPTGEDAVAEISELSRTNKAKISQEVAKIMPLSIADGLAAISYVRNHANDYEIDPTKIGFMGFSAGGAVTMGVAYNFTDENRPDFLVPVYPWTTEMPVQAPQKNAPPMLIVCASDDPLGLAPGSIELYQSYQNIGLNVALHMYSKGGHGFGMRKKGLATDRWIERFYDWAVVEGFVAK
ncbi:1,4-beta-xylanase [Labilibaculum filiforme]|uniref:1,4-beta-xylanase n=1 Tax=Labilibaculum filiforme TaxID=1940526 RepID=A0A2N3I3J3_9BACT|nr:alpha/beta hydrolase [Labilibaculum filiforme]PKQ64866.1 1,4-beta-xylanase [Labilibaculum filiforme]